MWGTLGLSEAPGGQGQHHAVEEAFLQQRQQDL